MSCCCGPGEVSLNLTAAAAAAGVPGEVLLNLLRAHTAAYNAICALPNGGEFKVGWGGCLALGVFTADIIASPRTGREWKPLNTLRALPNGGEFMVGWLQRCTPGFPSPAPSQSTGDTLLCFLTQPGCVALAGPFKNHSSGCRNRPKQTSLFTIAAVSFRCCPPPPTPPPTLSDWSDPHDAALQQLA